jgi:His-Xaa-Ser system radical SAM maturase HxsC
VTRFGEFNPIPKSQQALIVESFEQVIAGYALYLVFGAPDFVDEISGDFACIDESLSYLVTRDVVLVSADGSRVSVQWRTESMSNSLLLTEQCNHFCIMCSQPPKKEDDSYKFAIAQDVVELLPLETKQIGLSGGEPTLFGERLIALLEQTKRVAPNAGVHVLTNGRAFSNFDYAQQWARVEHPDLMPGIPLYSADPNVHDYIVQAKGAFQETVSGILNLGRLNQPIEIRVVIQKQNASSLPLLADYIVRNLPFVSQVALMGLEITGFARANFQDVWIDPADYQRELTQAVMSLENAGITTLIFNHQLCVLNPRLRQFAVSSISDWKREYLEECNGCILLEQCGGVFATSRGVVSEHIAKVVSNEQDKPEGERP